MLLLDRWWYLLVGMAITIVLCLIVVRWPLAWKLARNFSDSIQNSHSGLTSRVGGFPIVLASTVVYSLYVFRGGALSDKTYIVLLGLSCFIFIVGFLEDLISHIRPFYRVLGVCLFTVLGGFQLGWLDKLNIDLIDPYIAEWPLLAASITIFGVVGLTNSFNLIDGLNGLCSGTALIIYAVLIYLAKRLGLEEFVFFYQLLFFCLLGFFICNFPFGKIFLGDGGALFLGFAIAQGCIFLNSIDSPLSSWVFVLSCIYPIWETVFSFGRRIVRKKKWSLADRKHLHQLIYDWMLPGTDEHHSVKRNARAASVCLAFPLVSGVLSIVFYDNSLALKFACIALISVYLLLYFFLSKKISRRSVTIADS